MPEIPEMEIYKNYLNQYVINKPVTKVIIHRPKSLNVSEHKFIELVQDQIIKAVERKGKFLIFALEVDFLLTHMMLDGRLYFLPYEQVKDLSINLNDAEGLKKMLHGLPGKPSVIFTLSDGSILFFCKLTLGYLHYLKKDELDNALKDLGIDPLDVNFTPLKFQELLKGKRGMIKPWLMNQTYVAGVGNAYSNDCLFEAGILPTRQISSIEEEEKITLCKSLVKIIKESIKLGGDMEEPFAPWDHLTGGYNPYFKVYDREGKECKVCSNIIKREEVGGRNAFYCSNCQK